MASAAQLREIRRKAKIGEFAPKKKKSPLSSQSGTITASSSAQTKEAVLRGSRFNLGTAPYPETQP